MAKHIVKCAICGQQFDTNLILAVKHGARRYAHASCEPDNKDFVELGPEADPELIKLKEYIASLLGDAANWALINKQITKFKTENGYSYNGMLKSLVYFYEVKNNPKDKAMGGIGIIPFIYKDAYNYYYSLFLAQQSNINKDVVSYVSNVVEITISPPQARTKPKRLFNLDNEEEETNEE